MFALDEKSTETPERSTESGVNNTNSANFIYHVSCTVDASLKRKRFALAAHNLGGHENALASKSSEGSADTHPLDPKHTRVDKV